MFEKVLGNRLSMTIRIFLFMNMRQLFIPLTRLSKYISNVFLLILQ